MTTATKTRSLANWKKAKRHAVTLPSGFEIEIQVPNVPKMIKGGEIPSNLLDAAIGAQSGQIKVSRDLIEKQHEFYSYLVLHTVVDPELTANDVEELPYEDIEMIVEIATRQRDLDAVGHHLAGLETQDSFRKFRGLDFGIEAGEGA